jgi:hypothetical protein
MAREIRADPCPRDSGWWGCVGLLLAIALIVVASSTTERAAPGPLAVIGGMGIVAWVAYQLVQYFKPYRCPGCGDHLTEMICVGRHGSRNQEEMGPVYYQCPRCDIEWDSGRVWSDNAD